VRAECRNLDFQWLALLARTEHLDDAEAGADRDGAAKQPAHIIGPGVGGGVVVLGCQPEHLIAHAAAGPKGLAAGGAQPSDDIDGKVSFGHGPPWCCQHGAGPLSGLSLCGKVRSGKELPDAFAVGSKTPRRLRILTGAAWLSMARAFDERKHTARADRGDAEG